MEKIDNRKQELVTWLENEAQFHFDKIEPASEDASFRRYFRIYGRNETFIVMDAPPEKESCKPFLDITQRLLDCRVNVPQIMYKNTDKGFLVLTDFGDDQYLDVLDSNNADQLYSDAILSLLEIQENGQTQGLPVYSESMLQAEMMLFRDWLLSRHLKIKLSKEEESVLKKSFSFLVRQASDQTKVFVHRDYHSRNLLRTVNSNPGILDYQDAVSGPVTYDLVSLLKDCYIKWPKECIDRWLDKYYQAAVKVQPIEPLEEFITRFHLMGVQRHLKASGIFARLFHRDGKAGYLKDIERTLGYITELKNEAKELEGLIQLLEDKVLPVLPEANKICM